MEIHLNEQKFIETDFSLSSNNSNAVHFDTLNNERWNENLDEWSWKLVDMWALES